VNVWTNAYDKQVFNADQLSTVIVLGPVDLADIIKKILNELFTMQIMIIMKI
jgi:hypothetical protein